MVSSFLWVKTALHHSGMEIATRLGTARKRVRKHGNTTAQQQASQSVNQAITGLIVQRLTGGQ